AALEGGALGQERREALEGVSVGGGVAGLDGGEHGAGEAAGVSADLREALGPGGEAAGGVLEFEVLEAAEDPLADGALGVGGAVGAGRGDSDGRVESDAGAGERGGGAGPAAVVPGQGVADAVQVLIGGDLGVLAQVDTGEFGVGGHVAAPAEDEGVAIEAD